MTAAEIVQIIIGAVTLVFTALVPIMIYWLQKKHEKEVDAEKKEQKDKELENKANEFLIDHETERDYLPWCTIASALHRHERHTRKVYTDFCKCSNELQEKILKQAGFTCSVIKNSTWVNDRIDRLRKYIKDMDLGSDFLYDGAKYLHRSFERYRDSIWEDPDRIFKPIKKSTIFETLGIERTDIGTYIDDYLECKMQGGEKTEGIIPPIDYADQELGLRYCKEKELCKWILEIVFYITVIAHNKNLGKTEDVWRENFTDANAETFEDRYYETLLCLYYTFLE